jgi:hypothetical protein
MLLFLNNYLLLIIYYCIFRNNPIVNRYFFFKRNILNSFCKILLFPNNFILIRIMHYFSLYWNILNFLSILTFIILLKIWFLKCIASKIIIRCFWRYFFILCWYFNLIFFILRNILRNIFQTILFIFII